MIITIEFSMNALNSYQKKDSNYGTVDDQILDLIQDSLTERGLGVKVIKRELLDPVPNNHDEMLRYELDLEVEDKEFKPVWILESLEAEGYEKGLTIKDQKGNSLYHDEHTADILLRRKMQEK